METQFRTKDYIETIDLTRQELDTLIEVAFDLKRRNAMGEYQDHLLRAKTLYMIFLDNSTRTRNAFETAMTQLGGHAHFLTDSTLQIAHGETPEDTGVILSSMGHGIAIRHDLILNEGNAWMRAVAKHASCPVINLQCDVDHPTQTLADLMTAYEQFGRDLRGRKICMSWAYTKKYAKPLSVPQGVITLFTRFGMDVTLAMPPEYNLLPRCIEAARKNAEESGGKFEIVHDMDAGCENADIIYAKSWGPYDMMLERQGASPERMKALEEDMIKLNGKYKDWICDQRRMNLGSKDCIYMHCLPAERNAEVTDEVHDGPRSVVFREAENRLHTAKAILTTFLGGKPGLRTSQ
ncbi:MAG: ornithine carbamoyltransferase [Candidatus Hydrogenedentota bacterium]|nr:MAG: ornithine carbamoyltransferase [Candidatus Hydrogenedentota bacterium]